MFASYSIQQFEVLLYSSEAGSHGVGSGQMGSTRGNMPSAPLLNLGPSSTAPLPIVRLRLHFDFHFFLT
jgi:hypothetical protein